MFNNWLCRSNVEALDGENLEEHIRTYIEDGPKGVEWPCWELNDHDAISSQGDFGKFADSKWIGLKRHIFVTTEPKVAFTLGQNTPRKMKTTFFIYQIAKSTAYYAA